MGYELDSSAVGTSAVYAGSGENAGWSLIFLWREQLVEQRGDLFLGLILLDLHRSHLLVSPARDLGFVG